MTAARAVIANRGDPRGLRDAAERVVAELDTARARITELEAELDTAVRRATAAEQLVTVLGARRPLGDPL